MNRLAPLIASLACAAALGLPSASLAQDQPDPAFIPPPDAARTQAQRPPAWPGLDERLAALSPANPEAYFLLGEEAIDESQLDTAARLFVLAAVLDGERFGRSACLALAEIEKRRGRSALERNLRSLASFLGSGVEAGSSEVLDFRVAEREFRRAAALLSAMLGFYRQGDGQKALAALDLNAATERLVLEFGRSVGSIGRIISFSRNYPRCPTCRNERIIKCPTCRGGVVPGHCGVCRGQHFIICNTCNGKPGETITPAEIDAMLRFEVALQSGAAAPWSARLSVDGDRPRPVLDLTMLPRWYDVNTTLTVYRNGAWTVQ